MKKRQPVKKTEPVKDREYAERLAELAAELSSVRGRSPEAPPESMPSLAQIKAARVRGEEVVRFSHRGKGFAVGHTDSFFPGTNGARGVRRIHFYDETNAVVLGIVGEFENQQFGANFRFSQLLTCLPGAWEGPFMTITTGLRTFRGDRKEELRRSRAAVSRRR